MEQFSIGVDFESAATRRYKRERFDPVAEFENFGRQTDGFGRVVSNNAIFNRHFGLHTRTPFQNEPYRSDEAGQDGGQEC